MSCLENLLDNSKYLKLEVILKGNQIMNSHPGMMKTHICLDGTRTKNRGDDIERTNLYHNMIQINHEHLFSNDENLSLIVFEMEKKCTNHMVGVEHSNLYYNMIQLKEKVCNQYFKCTKHVRYGTINN